MTREKDTDKKPEENDDTFFYSMDVLGPYSSTSTSKQKAITWEDDSSTYELEFHAFILKDARATFASVLAMVAATAAYVN